MYYEWRIEIQGSESVINDPLNWRDVSLKYTFDYRIAKFEDIPSLEFCDKDLLASLEAEDPCEKVIIRIYSTNLQDPPEIFFQGIILPHEIDKSCDEEGIFSVPVRRESVLRALEENSRAKACILTDTKLQLFQLETGGLYVDDEGNPIEGNFISLLDLTNKMVSRFGEQGLIPSLGADLDETHTAAGSNSIYAPAFLTVRPSTIAPPNSVIRLQFNGEYGQSYDVNVTTPPAGWADVTEMCEAIANTIILYIGQGSLSLNMRAWEMYSRVARSYVNDIGFLLGKQITVEAYWNITQDFSCTIDGVDSGWSVFAQTHTYSNASDLFISGPGLTNEICISWAELLEIIQKTQGTYPKESATFQEFFFDTNANLQLPAAGYIPGFEPIVPEAFNVTSKNEPEYIKGSLTPGYAFRIKKYEEDRDSWEWVGQSLIPTLYRGTPSSDQIPYLELNGPCVAEFKGKIVLVNTNLTTAENYQLNFLVDGVQVNSVSGTIPANGNTVTIQMAPNFPVNAGTSYNTGQELEFTITGSGSSIFPAVPDTNWYIECEPFFERPFLHEDEANTHVIYKISDYENCRGVADETVSSNVYGGSGFAYAQQVEEKQDYSNTFFLTFKETGANRARRFEHQVYFSPTDAFIPTLLQGEVYSFFMYNSPIQLPRLIANLKNRIPSGINIPVYTFQSNRSGSGLYTSSVNYTEQSFEPLHKRKDLVSFKYCGDLLEWYKGILNENYFALEDICGFTGDGITRSIEFNLGTEEINAEVQK